MTKEDCAQVVEVFGNLNHYRSKGWLSFLGADYEIMRADGRAVYGKTVSRASITLKSLQGEVWCCVLPQ